jgi:hypothetical protein
MPSSEWKAVSELPGPPGVTLTAVEGYSILRDLLFTQVSAEGAASVEGSGWKARVLELGPRTSSAPADEEAVTHAPKCRDRDQGRRIQ